MPYLDVSLRNAGRAATNRAAQALAKGKTGQHYPL